MSSANRYYSGPVSSHFDGHRFTNPAGEPETDRSMRDILRWYRTAPRTRWPKSMPVSPIVPAERVEGLCITMVGHASVLIQTGGLNILTDPVWSNRASPLAFAGPRRVTAPGVRMSDLPPIDAVLLSHNHYDHLDVATLRQLQARHAPRIITPLGNDSIIRRHIPDARVETGDWFDRFDIAPGAQAHVVPALHWSSRGARDRRMALWGGFMLQAFGRTVYFAGDTGYGTGAIFRNLRARFGPVDVAILPIGAYAPRWFMAAQHTDPDDAIQIMLDLDAKAAVGMHWGTFKLTDEPWDEPARRLTASLRTGGIDAAKFIAMRPAETAEFE
ncbi:MBL fold metallo-hydrolase [Novosphingobium sp.]|uniref:MBL fold metallo-hydrolase n=2 Tax=Novosphingobium TaxID=165696 RepID=UPI0028B21791|nr:MBL fold metallo-hydrolase [Novosphingobium sp.]